MATDFIKTLDHLDRAILRELQEDNRQSLASVGYKIGLSEPSVRRRVKALRKHKVIIKDVSIVDPGITTLTVILAVRFENESKTTYDEFKKFVSQAPEISQCYSVTGEEDFILIGNFDGMERYDEWINEHILTRPYIMRTSTNVVYRRVKSSTAIDL